MTESTVTHASLRARPARAAFTLSPAGGFANDAAACHRPNEQESVLPNFLGRWENEGGTWLIDEPSTEINS